MKKLIILALLLSGCINKKTVIQHACTTSTTATGASISCPDGTIVEISNGAKGETGTQGAQGNIGPAGEAGKNGLDAVLEVIRPCGDEFANDEIFLKTSSGIVAVYDGGASLDRLVLLADGHYITSDRTSVQKCYFDVENGQVTNEVVR